MLYNPETSAPNLCHRMAYNEQHRFARRIACFSFSLDTIFQAAALFGESESKRSSPSHSYVAYAPHPLIPFFLFTIGLFLQILWLMKFWPVVNNSFVDLYWVEQGLEGSMTPLKSPSIGTIAGPGVPALMSTSETNSPAILQELEETEEYIARFNSASDKHYGEEDNCVIIATEHAQMRYLPFYMTGSICRACLVVVFSTRHFDLSQVLGVIYFLVNVYAFFGILGGSGGQLFPPKNVLTYHVIRLRMAISALYLWKIRGALDNANTDPVGPEAFNRIGMIPPTGRLPPIKRIADTDIHILIDAVDYLCVIYNPEVRGSRRRGLTRDTPGKTADDQSARMRLDELRTDDFERAYAIKWMTALIASLTSDEDTYQAPTHDRDEKTSTSSETLLQKAASLLAICAGTASAGEIVRNFAFETKDGQLLRVDLRDVPLDNQDYGSVGAQTWGGACVLAEMIVEKPHEFGLVAPALGTSPVPGKRIRVLELGAGTGLVSLAAARWVESFATPSSNVDIVATDYYPSVLENLKTNIQSNFPSTNLDVLSISACRLDWSSFCSCKDIPPQLDNAFDVVLGADIIYEALHAQWIKSCLETLLRRPGGGPNDDPLFHLVIPLRSTHTSESNTIEQVFPKQQETGFEGGKTDMKLVIKYKEVIICEAERGREEEEVRYSYYRMGWGFHK
ncbi:hypothetical protein CVT24_008870 [Panaeolus cyanescens]|uniref:Uncharacterized protein n=1 Tax=Panaeolus cyanescens TaxID=181874 RepID=A0A409VES3_9AGAR|nr:hypothetical protein CVT24_008870 [Panaeolus cyanescens]